MLKANKGVTAGILAIGTEVTSGQILNRNAQWLATQLEKQGVEVLFHMSVPDERERILHTLDFLSAQNIDLIFITGGLGPTSDDLTRQVVADWVEQTLQFHPEVCQRIEQKLNEMGRQLKEIQKVQAYFPQGAQIILNPRGTAEGFYVAKSSTQLWALPGPPRELEVMFLEGVLPALQNQMQGHAKKNLLSWDCLGLPESEVASLVEPCVAGSSLNVGYRARLSLVETKLWFTSEQESVASEVAHKIDQVLLPWIVARDGQDHAEILCKGLQKFELVLVQDEFTNGLLAERLLQLKHKTNCSFTLQMIVGQLRQPVQLSHADDCLFEVVALEQEGLLECRLHTVNGVSSLTQKFSRKGLAHLEFNQKWAVEWSLHLWLKLLQG